MSNVLFASDEDNIQKINIDELYERNMRREQKNISIFNKILNRIHKRINITAKIKKDKHIWFTVPHFLFGQPLYHQGNCIAYIIEKLSENGFHVKYMHPNTLFLSWEQWIPSYIRLEYKKKTGIIINEKGEVLNPIETIEEQPIPNIIVDKEQKYTPIAKYKPTGNLVYNPDMFHAIAGTKN
jgi:hypothetical protein